MGDLAKFLRSAGAQAGGGVDPNADMSDDELELRYLQKHPESTAALKDAGPMAALQFQQTAMKQNEQAQRSAAAEQLKKQKAAGVEQPNYEESTLDAIPGGKLINQGLGYVGAAGRAINENLGKLSTAVGSPMTGSFSKQFSAAMVPQGPQATAEDFRKNPTLGGALNQIFDIGAVIPQVVKGVGEVAGPRAQEYVAKPAGAAAEELAQLATDPVTYGGLGVLSKVAPKASAVLHRLFQAQMATGAIDEAAKTAIKASDEGISPDVLAGLVRTGITTKFAADATKGDVGSVRDLLKRIKEGPAQAKPEATQGTPDPALGEQLRPGGIQVDTVGERPSDDVSKYGKVGRGLGHGAAAAVGAIGGGALGHPFIGAGIGERALGSSFGDVGQKAAEALARAAGKMRGEAPIPGGEFKAGELPNVGEWRQTADQPEVGNVVPQAPENPFANLNPTEVEQALSGLNQPAPQNPFAGAMDNPFESEQALRTLNEGIANTQEAQRQAAAQAAAGQPEGAPNPIEAAKAHAADIEADVIRRKAELKKQKQDLAEKAHADKVAAAEEKALAAKRKAEDEAAAKTVAEQDPFQTNQNLSPEEARAAMDAANWQGNEARGGFGGFTPEEQQTLLARLGLSHQQPTALTEGGAGLRAEPPAEPLSPGYQAIQDRVDALTGKPPAEGGGEPPTAPEGGAPLSRGERAAQEAGLTRAEQESHPAYQDVMRRFGEGTLKTTRGPKGKKVEVEVTDPQVARGIAFSEALKAIKEERAKSQPLEPGKQGPEFKLTPEEASQMLEGLKDGSRTPEDIANDIIDASVAKEGRLNPGSIRAALVKAGLPPAIFEPVLGPALDRYRAANPDAAATEAAPEPSTQVEDKFAAAKAAQTGSPFDQMPEEIRKALGGPEPPPEAAAPEAPPEPPPAAPPTPPKGGKRGAKKAPVAAQEAPGAAPAEAQPPAPTEPPTTPPAAPAAGGDVVTKGSLKGLRVGDRTPSGKYIKEISPEGYVNVLSDTPPKLEQRRSIPKGEEPLPRKGLLETQKVDLTPRLGKNPRDSEGEPAPTPAQKNLFEESDGIKGAVEETPGKTPEQVDKPSGTVEKGGVVASRDGIAPALYSTRTVDETIKRAEEVNKKLNVYTPEQIAKYKEDLNGVAAMIHANPEVLDFTPLEGAQPLKSNGDKRYPVSEDYTTICRRGYELRDTVDAIQAKTGKMLEADDVVSLQQHLRKLGHEVNCGPCYVFSRRMKMSTAIDKAIEGYDIKTGKRKGEFVQLTPENAKRALTQEGRNWMFVNDRPQYDVLSAAFAGLQAKVPIGRAEYKSQYMDLSPQDIADMNRYSGARSNSWSDFEVPHLLDKMQAVLDKSILGLKAQAYTKETEYLETQKDTNESINMSLIPEGTGLNPDGSFRWNPKESFRDIKRGYEVRKDHDNVGFEAIGISDDHIKALLASPDIDYVIPFHDSGQSKAHQRVQGMDGWTNYTKEQSWTNAATGEKVGLDPEREARNVLRDERWDALSPEEQAARLKDHEGKKNPEGAAKGQLAKEEWAKLSDKERQERMDRAPVEIFVDEWKGDLNKLDELAAKRGVVPPFSRMRDWPGYEKLLIDRRIWDADHNFIEQKPVQFKFDMDYIRKMMADYKGGHDQDNSVPEVVDDWLAGKIEKPKELQQAREAAGAGAEPSTEKLKKVDDFEVPKEASATGKPFKIPAYESGSDNWLITGAPGDAKSLNLTHKGSGLSIGVNLPNAPKYQKALQDATAQIEDILQGRDPRDVAKNDKDAGRAIGQIVRDLQGMAPQRAGGRRPATPAAAKKPSMWQTMKDAMARTSDVKQQLEPKTGEQARELAKKDPVGYALDSATNFLLDNMNRTAHKTPIGQQFGERSDLAEGYKGGLIKEQQNNPNALGYRRPTWLQGGLSPAQGEIAVARTTSLAEAADRLATTMGIKSPGFLLKKVIEGNEHATQILADEYKRGLQDTLAHEVLHGFKDTVDTTPTMQRQMNESARKMLDEKLPDGSTLRDGLSQYFDAKSMQPHWQAEVKRLAQSALDNYHPTSVNQKAKAAPLEQQRSGAQPQQLNFLDQMKGEAAKSLGVTPEAAPEAAPAPAKKPSFSERMKQEEELVKTAGNTATDRGISTPAKIWSGVDENGKPVKGGQDYIKGKSVIDWGTGKGADLPHYEAAGATKVQGYDVNHMPKKPEGMADIVTNTYVGNVLPPEPRHQMWRDAFARAKDKMLVTVRNEVPEGIRPHEDGVIVKLKGKENFQRAYTQDQIVSELQKLFPDATVSAGPKLSAGVTAVVQRKSGVKAPAPRGPLDIGSGYGRGRLRYGR